MDTLPVLRVVLCRPNGICLCNAPVEPVSSFRALLTLRRAFRFVTRPTIDTAGVLLATVVPSR